MGNIHIQSVLAIANPDIESNMALDQLMVAVRACPIFTLLHQQPPSIHPRVAIGARERRGETRGGGERIVSTAGKVSK